MIDIKKLTELSESLGCRIIPECVLSEYVTFRFGGPCRALISINSAESAAELIKYMKANSIKFGILGRGSNVMVPDEGFDGIILLFGSMYAGIEVNGNELKCSSGAALSAICVRAQQLGLSGMERLFGIPGTVGGAVYMNAGAYKSEMKDIVVSAEYIDADCNIRTIENKDMKFSYRHSIFCENGGVVTSVTLRLEKGDPDAIKATMSEYLDKRRSKQPLEYPSAGSTFKRPKDNYASKLIDECGLRGLSCGGAMVSEKHAGFVINKGFATCADVLELCGRIQDIVKEKTGYELELEPVILK